jgi:16S rRNA (guanine527-N7)-methyltransferase
VTDPSDSDLTRPAPNGAGRFMSELVDVTSWLDRSRALGFLGPGPVEQHRDHARALARVALSTIPLPNAICDLGAGGGVPGLVMAALQPSPITLLDSMHRRTLFLCEAISALGFEHATVVTERAETFARRSEERFDLVIARSFGRPSVTAEIAARMMTINGALCVSSGPETRTVWQDPSLEMLGLAFEAEVPDSGATFVVVRKVAATPDRYPRRVGRPAKSPLW